MLSEDLNNLLAADRLPTLCSKTPQACSVRKQKCDQKASYNSLREQVFCRIDNKYPSPEDNAQRFQLLNLLIVLFGIIP